MRPFLFVLIAMLLITGCAPSVRYTRPERIGQTQPTPPATATAPREDVKTPEPQQQQAQPGRRTGKKGSQKLLEEVISSYLGTPYRWGGTTASGFDCSGFTLTVYREVYDISLPRSSSAQWKLGRKIPLSVARPGDLVFFKGSNFSDIGHVGIYMGNNRFVHASSSLGVVYGEMSETYYARRFVGVRRMM